MLFAEATRAAEQCREVIASLPQYLMRLKAAHPDPAEAEIIHQKLAEAWYGYQERLHQEGFSREVVEMVARDYGRLTSLRLFA